MTHFENCSTNQLAILCICVLYLPKIRTKRQTGEKEVTIRINQKFSLSRSTVLVVEVDKTIHSSEIRGLCLMKLSSETLQNFPYFWNKKTQIVVFSSTQSSASIVTIPKLLRMKNEKNLFGFSYSKNMANFKAFHQTISSSKNLLFLKSDKSAFFEEQIPSMF